MTKAPTQTERSQFKAETGLPVGIPYKFNSSYKFIVDLECFEKKHTYQRKQHSIIVFLVHFE